MFERWSACIAAWAASRSPVLSPAESTSLPQPASRAAAAAPATATRTPLPALGLRVRRDDLEDGRHRARGHRASLHGPVGDERELLGAAVGPARARRGLEVQVAAVDPRKELDG